MSTINNNRYRNILGTISIAKFGVLLLVSIISINELVNNSDYLGGISLNNYAILFIPMFLLIAILLWSFSYIYIFKFRNIEVVQMVEDCAFTLMLCILILLSHTYQSQYKYLFIFSIISSTISFGKKRGILVSIVSSIIILFIDLFFAPNLKVNIYFENDLMLALGFIMIAWVLGEYKKFESDQRELLESELKEQVRQHDYIEEMLLKNEDCYNLLIKYSHYAIMIHDGNKIQYLNEKALELFGIKSSEEIKRKSLFTFYNLEDEIKTKAKYLDIIDNKKSNVSFEEKIVNRDGENINIHNVSTYCSYGKTPVILTIMRDITPEKQVQELKKEVKENIKLLNETQEQNKFITEFFSNISHELKTPLNVIFSSLQLLNVYDDEEFIKNRKKYLDVMKQNCYRLIKLVNNLLDIIKYDSGFIIPNKQNEDIVSIIEAIAMSIVPYAESKGIELIFDTDIEEKILAFDVDKMERIILNLLSNALKFTDSGGCIYINVSDKGDKVEISVRDTGIGIPADKKEFIFERFTQVDKTLKRNHEGTGIGLSLVKSFVEIHDGEIKLESELGQGSEFIIMLPSKEIEDTRIETEIKDDIIERVNMELSDVYFGGF
ncbi:MULTISPECIES: PAS domain-containing sensor histidine kinase [unclassified Clostridium]|uniref:PAS domain-containing sensor histidine kinase n=1 Tax=unclassified Clostridium TaxID=2614128 RepID=UPI000297C0A1|nr:MULTISPECIES: PAS domain-containing sensor histidine kinase [unclassified Clostridium]EKQ51287.1 MAG: PAS domain S-box [Clostridium sp. Maddingley MBC34-26]